VSCYCTRLRFVTSDGTRVKWN